MIPQNDDDLNTLDQDTLDMDNGRAFHVGDILVYQDGQKDQIIGFEEVKMENSRTGGHEWVPMLAVDRLIVG